MPLITTRLDRIFDVVHLARYEGEATTLFSIECGGQRHFGITLPGHITCQDGMIVTAYLEREHDWQTLRGWRDHATGEVIYRSAARSLLTGWGALLCTFLPMMCFTGAPVVSALLIFVGLALFAAGVQYQRKGAAALAQLRQSSPS